MWFANFAAICELILMVFLRHKLLCCNLQLSLQKNWLSFSTFFQSILMQSNSISAKIAILSLIWRSNHQRWCCWIYWPYVRDIRPTLRGVASLSSRGPGLQLFSARLTFLIWLLQMLKQKLKFLRKKAYNKSKSWLQRPAFNQTSLINFSPFYQTLISLF